MPKLLQITDKPEQGGGIRRAVDQQRRMLEALSWRVDLLRLVPNGPSRTLADKAAESGRGAVSVRLRGGPSQAASSVAALRRAAQGADVIQLHLGFATLVPELAAAAAETAPLVTVLHDVSPFEALGPSRGVLGAGRSRLPLREGIGRLRHRPMRRALWHLLCERSRLFIAPSAYLARCAVAAGLDEAKLRVIPHAVEAEVPAAPPPSRQAPVVLYAGLISEDKGACLLVEAFARLRVPGARLVLLGDGPALPALRRRAARLGLARQVTFHGRVAGEEVRRAMARARCLAHPSLVPEGFGLVGMEAMQLGRPVVGFGLGGTESWLVDGESGLVAAPTDAAALAEAIDRVLRDDALADRLGAAARCRVERDFLEPRVAAALARALTAAMAGPAARLSEGVA
ncbi:glycosyltransferase family 4 protein [Acidimangrovimonas pyrenivorans]|uniref:Glycosyltransferase family 4 protein n=1 Tax=Acidimangrovimonas pyrenivorans TaxID=2030798 RepID=A0ABV7AGQ0_9RHOB